MLSSESEYPLIGSAYTHGQHVGLVATGTVSSVLSIIGSSIILYMSFGKLRDKRPYHRFMFGLSIADIIFSVSCLSQPWMVPAESSASSISRGTFVTCSAVGFLWMTAAAVAAIYNCCLSVSFLLIVVFNWSNQRISNSYERVAHAVAWCWPLLYMIPVVLTKSISPDDMSLICVADTYPPGCSLDENDDNSPPCTRGEYVLFFEPLITGTVAFVSLSGIVATIWVCLSYQKQIKTSAGYDFSAELSQDRLKILNAVTNRSICYTLIYVNTLLWVGLIKFVSLIAPDLGTTASIPTGWYALLVLAWFFYPLQGFLNMVVYVRSELITAQTLHPEESRVKLFGRVLSQGGAGRRFSMSRRSSQGSEMPRSQSSDTIQMPGDV